MRYMSSFLRMRNLVLCFLIPAVAGCTDSQELSSATAIKLRRVALVYLDYAVAKGVGPSSEKQLRAHAANVPCFDPAAVSDPLGEKGPLLSERDGQELVVRYGCRVCLQQGDKAAPIAFESAGVDGTRLIAFADGKVACVEEKEVMERLGANGIAGREDSRSKRGGTGL